MTSFNLFTFFRADLIQSEASWKLSSTLVNVCIKECGLIKGGHSLKLLMKWNTLTRMTSLISLRQGTFLCTNLINDGIS